MILWSRMGTPLKHDNQSYQSGTHYEYLDAVQADRKPRVLLFRCTAPPDDASRQVDFGETPQQRQAQLAVVKRFFDGFREDDGRLRGSAIPYRDSEQFRYCASRLLRNVLDECLDLRRSKCSRRGSCALFPAKD